MLHLSVSDSRFSQALSVLYSLNFSTVLAVLFPRSLLFLANLGIGMLDMGIQKLMRVSSLRVQVGFQQLRNSGATSFSSATF